MDDTTEKIVLTIVGVIVGFIGNWVLAKFNARNELKKAIAEKRSDSYVKLWILCEPEFSSKEEMAKRLTELKKWYSEGGGLLLSFKATNRFLGVINLLQSSVIKELGKDEKNRLSENLSWLRTEMKYEVGSYSRCEAKKKLPNSKEKTATNKG